MSFCLLFMASVSYGIAWAGFIAGDFHAVVFACIAMELFKKGFEARDRKREIETTELELRGSILLRLIERGDVVVMWRYGDNDET